MRHTARTPIATLVLTLCALVAAALLVPMAVANAAAHRTQPKAEDATAGCQAAPPPPVDASENPQPGQTSPAPVPEPATPAGGPNMASCGVILPPGAPALPQGIGYQSWVLQDLDTGAVLAAADPHARERPASLIKLLLSLVVSRNLDPNAVITGTQDDANQQGTRIGIGPGGQYTVSQVVHALLMHSGNDAAYALAMQLGGYQVAVDKMNALAKQLGALDTRTATPSGLDGPGMATSAYDLSVIFRAALATPMLADAVHTSQMQFPGYPGHPAPFTIDNDNWLLGTYPGDLGGKTGYTDDALQTYANAAAQGGHRVALIGMRGETHLEGSHKDSKELMDYGFALEAAHTPSVGQIVSAGPATTTAPQTSGAAVAKPVKAAGKPASSSQGGSVNSGLSPFGTVGIPVTILAALGILVIGLMYLRRQRQRKARIARARAAAKAAAEAKLVPGTTLTNGVTSTAVVTDPDVKKRRTNGVAITEQTDVFDRLQ